MSESYIGEIRTVGFSFAPEGWLPCDGRMVQIADYEALYMLLGTYYGGDGQTTFGIPDLRGRVPVGQGARRGGATRAIGELGGRESVALTNQTMPQHTHRLENLTVALPATNGAATTNRPVGAIPAAGGSYTATADGTMAPAPLSGSTAVAGEGLPFPLGPPSLAITFIICTAGPYPSSN